MVVSGKYDKQYSHTAPVHTLTQTQIVGASHAYAHVRWIERLLVLDLRSTMLVCPRLSATSRRDISLNTLCFMLTMCSGSAHPEAVADLQVARRPQRAAPQVSQSETWTLALLA